MMTDEIYALPGTVIDGATVNNLRGLAHLAMFIVLLGFVRTTPKPRQRVPLSLPLVIATLTITAMGVSHIMTGTVAEGMPRLAIQTVAAINFFVLLTAISNQLADFSRYYLAWALGLGALAIIAQVQFGSYSEFSIRLGRPLNPGVFSGFMFIAFTLAFFLKRPLYSIPFLILLVASGSRTALGSVLIVLILYYYRDKRFVLAAIPGIPLAIVLLNIPEYIANLSNSALYERSGWSSGRVVVWLQALDVLPQNWLWGIGNRFDLYVEHLGRDQRLHNGPLEAVLSYGILFAITTTAFYVYFACKAFFFSGHLSTKESYCFRAIMIYALVEFLFGTMYWTNLGDGFSMTIVALCLFFNSRRKTSNDSATDARLLSTAGTRAHRVDGLRQDENNVAQDDPPIDRPRSHFAHCRFIVASGLHPSLRRCAHACNHEDDWKVAFSRKHRRGPTILDVEPTRFK